MKHLLVVLAFAALAGCASSTPTTYNQSAYSPAPRAPAFSPTMDAPHTMGQPGHVQPGIQVEPGPRSKRVLPQTEETRRQAGMWAYDTTHASGSVAPRVLDVLLPLPSVDSVDDMRPTVVCAKSVDAAARSILGKTELAAMSSRFRMCLAALLGYECTNRLSLAFENARKQAEHYDPAETAKWKAANRAARDFFTAACGGDLPNDGMKRLASRIMAEWSRVMSATNP